MHFTQFLVLSTLTIRSLVSCAPIGSHAESTRINTNALQHYKSAATTTATSIVPAATGSDQAQSDTAADADSGDSAALKWWHGLTDAEQGLLIAGGVVTAAMVGTGVGLWSTGMTLSEFWDRLSGGVDPLKDLTPQEIDDRARYSFEELSEYDESVLGYTRSINQYGKLYLADQAENTEKWRKRIYEEPKNDNQLKKLVKAMFQDDVSRSAKNVQEGEKYATEAYENYWTQQRMAIESIAEEGDATPEELAQRLQALQDSKDLADAQLRVIKRQQNFQTATKNRVNKFWKNSDFKGKSIKYESRYQLVAKGEDPPMKYEDTDMAQKAQKNLEDDFPIANVDIDLSHTEAPTSLSELSSLELPTELPVTPNDLEAVDSLANEGEVAVSELTRFIRPP